MIRHSRVLVASLSLLVVALVSFFGSQLFTNHPALAAQPSSSGTPSTGVALPSCLSNATPPRCYSPQQIRAAYGIQPLLDAGITGRGRTIVIIGNNPYANMKDDLHLYDQMFGLSDPTFNILEPFGPVAPTSEAPQLVQDVEIAHAIAPGATIDLVAVDASRAVGPPARISMLLRGTEYAIDHNLGDIISQSFAAGESCLDPTTVATAHRAFQEAAAKHMTVLAASGDIGVGQVCSTAGLSKAVSYPASDPLVTAVGATALNANVKTGAYQGETGWTQTPTDAGASGGGFSTTFARPAYQNGVKGIGAFRGVPDVAADGDFFTQMAMVYIVNGTVKFNPAGGTGQATAEWAGLMALSDQLAGHSLGFVNAALYRVGQGPLAASAFHDITAGNNTISWAFPAGSQPTTIQGYSAGPGWDAMTGLGSPRAAVLVLLLAHSVRPGDGNDL